MILSGKNRKNKKTWSLIIFIVILSAGIGLKVYSLFNASDVNIEINNQSYQVMIADNAEKAYKGLSGKKDLGKYSGMLFLFNHEDYYTMVMRDMNFPIDIVWIKNGVIVDMAPNVLPESDEIQDKDLVHYVSRLPADAVLELKKGFILENGLKIGDKIGLTNN